MKESKKESGEGWGFHGIYLSSKALLGFNPKYSEKGKAKDKTHKNLETVTKQGTLWGQERAG